MARRDNTSCAGTGYAGYLLLGVVGLGGCLLALPVLLPDLLAERTPPLKVEGADQWAVVHAVPVVVACVLTAVAGRGGRFVCWLFLLRTALLLAAAVGAALYVEGLVAGRPWSVRAPVEGLVAGLVALVTHLLVRRWDERRGARPFPGEVWLAMVPLREDPERQLRHYCVVLETGSGGARVAQITSKDKDGRRDHIRIPNTGWDEVSGRPHWVEIGRQPRVVPYRRFLKSRPQGRCPDAVWAQLQSRRPAAPARPAGTGSPQWTASRLLRGVLARYRG
ncbi:hypothetical protein ACFV7Q_37025 [Streptomyces sp. NPDC059851]|uniref:hypothetical protein n=1 Tax=Streptomyces sp. NPDC059851 TaxID=3346971 RepID=UPI003663D956